MAYYPKIALVLLACLSFCLIFVYYGTVIFNSYVCKEKTQDRSQGSYENQTMELLFGDNLNIDYLINTPGCYIPNYARNLKFISPQSSNETCGQRAIFIKPVGSNKILFKIDKARMEQYVTKKGKYECCYRFATSSLSPERQHKHLTYSKCMPFKDGSRAKLLQEVITVYCIEKLNRKTEVVYEDAYIIIKKVVINKKNTARKSSWNVLILGIDTMSRARVYHTMPQTVRYLREHNWLDYKAYQKVAYKTFPSLMTTHTKMGNSSYLQQFCENHVWNLFKSSGYMTAFGENLLPGTLHRLPCMNSSASHAILPLFLTGENRVGSFMCTKQLPSSNHILDYAYQFINSYKYQNFFTMFWINSNRYSLRNMPTLIDDDIVDFLKKINQTHILKNTFIYFLSDNGVRFDTMKIQMQSYYEERLPMLFMWVPHEFKKIYVKLYNNLKVNQNRLVTPYDLYNTLADIEELSHNSNNNTFRSETCEKCKGLFAEKSPNRTCADAGVDEKSCSCHNMTEVKPKSIGVKLSLALAVSYIRNKAKSTNTIPCMQCYNLNLKTILRTHTYKKANEFFYVIAFVMSPGDILYEVTVVNNGKTFRIIQPPYTFSYNTKGNCVISPIDRTYCVCQKTKCP